MKAKLILDSDIPYIEPIELLGYSEIVYSDEEAYNKGESF